MSLQLLTLAVAAAGFSMVGIVYDCDAAYFMCTALLSVMLVSFLASRLSARALVWRREVADRGFEEEPFTVTLEVTNRGRLPLFFVRVSDTLPPFVQAVEAPHFMLATLWPGEQATLVYHATAAKRGVFPLGPLQVAVSDPFGVFQRARPVDLPGEAVVRPRPLPLQAELEQEGMDLRGLVTGDLSRASDSGMDFYGIRDYQPGDELRRIHWPATAHHGKITVVEFERGTSGSVLVVLDTRTGSEVGSGLHTSLEVGVKAAASVLHWALENDGGASLAYGTAEEVGWAQAEGGLQEESVLEALAWARAEGKLPQAALIEWAAPRAPAGALVVLITAAPGASLPAAIQWLTSSNCRVVVFLLDPRAFGAHEGVPTAWEDELRAAGAHVAVYQAGMDLRRYLINALLDHN